jgi:hypothetical protein
MKTFKLVYLLPFFIVGCAQKTTAVPVTENQTSAIATEQKTSVNSPSAQNKLISKKAPLDKVVLSKTSLAELKQLKENFAALIADKTCDNSSQCRVIAVGSRACGGPSSYAVFSSKMANKNKVNTLADKVTKYESQYNAQTGRMSICQHLVAPSTQCINNVCEKFDSLKHVTH